MDPALERLVYGAGSTAPCGANGQYVSGAPPCTFDHAAFKKLTSQYGFAVAPMAMYPARTTGFGGFQIAVQAAFTSIANDADYWQKGTRGSPDPNTGLYPAKNTDPDGRLGLYGVSVRKGLPFGFELGVSVGYLAHTSIFSGGADLRASLLEGFRTGVLGILPDLSVGIGIRTITGTPQFKLTVGTADLVLSKPIAVGGISVLTPTVGYQFVRIYADSGPIDGTPNTDPLAACNYQGQNDRGQPICGAGGTAADFNNTQVFDNARINRHRLVLGVHYRYEILVVGAQFVTDLVAPKDANDGATAQALDGVPRQNTIAVELGATF